MIDYVIKSIKKAAEAALTFLMKARTCSQQLN